jgi:hypothetical protein
MALHELVCWNSHSGNDISCPDIVGVRLTAYNEVIERALELFHAHIAERVYLCDCCTGGYRGDRPTSGLVASADQGVILSIGRGPI